MCKGVFLSVFEHVRFRVKTLIKRLTKDDFHTLKMRHAIHFHPLEITTTKLF